MTVTGMQQRVRERPTVEQALAVVGLDLAEVQRLAGSVLDAGPAYLVGSLAGGLGNRGSDVDLHLLVDGLDRPSPAFLLFADQTPVDVEHYPGAMPGRLLAQARSVPVVDLPFGRVSAGPPVERRTRRTAARWLGALPLLPGQPPIYDPQQSGQLLPVVLRPAVDALLQLWAVARLAALLPDARDAARYLFARAGRELLEVRCRAAGDVMTSEKWLPDRAARTGLPAGQVRAHFAVADEAGLRRLVDELGCSHWDPWLMTRVVPDRRCRPVQLGQQRLALTGHGRLVPALPAAAGPLAEVLQQVPPVRLLAALRRGELELDVVLRQDQGEPDD